MYVVIYKNNEVCAEFSASGSGSIYYFLRENGYPDFEWSDLPREGKKHKQEFGEYRWERYTKRSDYLTAKAVKGQEL